MAYALKALDEERFLSTNLPAAYADYAEVELDHLAALLGETERLRAVLCAGLAIRSSRPQPTDDRLLGIGRPVRGSAHRT